jgi:uncharacterized protein (DUF1697 family)
MLSMSKLRDVVAALGFDDVRTALQAAVTGPEVIRAAGRELYVTYPDGMGRSRLTGGLIERKLKSRATARNWNTVLKLEALARPAPAAP